MTMAHFSTLENGGCPTSPAFGDVGDNSFRLVGCPIHFAFFPKWMENSNAGLSMNPCAPLIAQSHRAMSGNDRPNSRHVKNKKRQGTTSVVPNRSLKETRGFSLCPQ